MGADEKPAPAGARLTWLTPFWNAWIDEYGDEPDGGRLASGLAPLVRRHDPATVLEHWRNYLGSTELRFVSPRRFAETFPAWGRRRLGTPADPLDQLPGESIDDYAARLSRL